MSLERTPERSKRVAIAEFILAVALVVVAAVTGIWFAYIVAAVALLFAGFVWMRASQELNGRGGGRSRSRGGQQRRGDGGARGRVTEHDHADDGDHVPGRPRTACRPAVAAAAANTSSMPVSARDGLYPDTTPITGPMSSAPSRPEMTA